MQSFAFDAVNRKLFTCTLLDGGNNRDLAIQRVSVQTGAPISSSMIVRNAGHGIAFGVEGIGTDSYIWIEQSAVITTGDSGDYFGTRLRRFRYDGGRDTGVDTEPNTGGYAGDQTRLSGSWMITCSVDQNYPYPDGAARLAVRRRDLSTDGTSGTGLTRYEVYRLGGLTTAPVLEWAAQATGLGTTNFQGWTFYNNRVYKLTGNAGQNDHRIYVEAPASTTITDYNQNAMSQDAGTLQIVHTGISGSEPEGMGVFQPTAGVVGLYYGEASDNSTRKNSIFYFQTT